MPKFNRRNLLGLFGSTLSTGAISKLGFAQSSRKAAAEYDYIIVGSGAGGGPLAVNLSQAGFKVLLLEAGNDQGQNPAYQVPAFHAKSTEDSEMAWDFYVDHFSQASKNAADTKYVKGQGILYPRAGTLGGCTAHNAMITVYPLAKDWDRMGDDIGDSSYNAETMRKYFSLCENAQYSQDSERKKGWLQTHLPSPTLVLGDGTVTTLLFSAWRKFRKDVPTGNSGLSSLLKLLSDSDPNTEAFSHDRREGLVMIPLATNAKGRRYSTRDLLLEKKNANLSIRTSALVSRVIFEESNDGPVAIGVEYIVGDKIYQAAKNPNPSSKKLNQVFAKHDVILAAGTFNTPQILMNSGIGPKEDLSVFESQNYRVILDRPGVGRNLQDRYEVCVVSETKEELAITGACNFKADAQDTCYSWWKDEGSGPYTSSGGIIGMFKKSNQGVSDPDLFMFLLPTDFHGYFPGYSKVVANSHDKFTWAILKTHSANNAGTVKLKDLDPSSRPLINFHYYEEGTDSTGKDLEAVLDGIEFVRSINANATTTLDIFSLDSEIPEGPLPKRSIEESIPGPSYNSRSKLREWVRRNSWGHHACGTCKMGSESDEMAVVNSKFEVIGTRNLRIVDASIFPRIPGYFIASSVYTISERATDEILESRGRARRVHL